MALIQGNSAISTSATNLWSGRCLRGPSAVRVAVVAVNVWAVALAVPIASAGSPSWALGSVVTLAPVVIGLAGHRRWAIVWLAGVFPCLLLASLGLYDRTGTYHHAAWLPLIAGVSLVVYGAVVARELGRMQRGAAAQHKALGAANVPIEASGRRWRQRVVLGIGVLGALALVGIGPAAGGEAGLASTWGKAARAAGALTALTGGALGCAVMAAFVGPGLRRLRPPPARRTRSRVAMYLMVAGMGAVVHMLLHTR